MSNSTLATYTKISPNRNSPRNHKIDTITIHCVVGQLTAKEICNLFASSSAKASCNYAIGRDGDVGLCVPEEDRSWCSSSSANDNRAVTIECASDKTHPYAINDKVYATLVKLCADICRRNDIPKLLWKADKRLIRKVDQQNMTVHRWFANKECPGDYIYERLGTIAKEVNALLGEKEPKGLQAVELKYLTEAETVAKMGPLFTQEQKNSGILASVAFAQFILESGYGKTSLAQNANNCFGMKASLSGNTWEGSTWDGTEYKHKTQEFENGEYVTEIAKFRKYPCVEDSIADHSAYLLGATKGFVKRYDGLKGCPDYRKAIKIIKNGGYATDPNYVEKICNIIDRWDLTRFDVGHAPKEPAKKTESFKVRVSIHNLNIRTGPGKAYTRTSFIPAGVYTIVEVKDGDGSKAGWGKLLSGAGWISLDFVERLE